MSKTTDNVAIDFNGKALALKGYDVMAYFTDNAPVAGRSDISVVHEGVEYRFANAQHRDTFTADPQAYLPQFGGFCAFGVSEGAKLDVDPAAFKVVNGKLYLNNSLDIHNMWLPEREARIQKASQNWPDLRDATAQDQSA